jgi:hypothetical protein
MVVALPCQFNVETEGHTFLTQAVLLRNRTFCATTDLYEWQFCKNPPEILHYNGGYISSACDVLALKGDIVKPINAAIHKDPSYIRRDFDMIDGLEGLEGLEFPSSCGQPGPWCRKSYIERLSTCCPNQRQCDVNFNDVEDQR